MIEELPVAAPDGHVELDGLMDRVVALRAAIGFASERGQKAEAVLGRIGGELRAGDRGAGGHHIGEAHSGIRHTSGAAARPAHDERHAMPAFPIITLHPAPGPRAVVIEVRAHVDDAGGFGTVVAGEDDERVVRDAQFLQRHHQLADDVIQLGDEITVRPSLGLALEFRCRERRQMHGVHRVIQEEGLRRLALHLLREPCLALVEEHEVQPLVIVAGRDEAAAAVIRIRMLRQHGGIERMIRRHRHAVVLDEGIQPVRPRTARRAEEIIEAAMHRAIGDGLREIHEPHAREFRGRAIPVATDLCLMHRRAVRGLKRHADMPLAHASRRIALCAQHPRQCHPIRFDQARPAHAREDPAAIARAETHAARHDAVARRRAYRRSRVGIRESHAFAREVVEIRRRHLRLRIVAADIAVAEIVGENEDDIGTLRRTGGMAVKQQEQDEKVTRHHGWPVVPQSFPSSSNISGSVFFSSSRVNGKKSLRLKYASVFSAKYSIGFVIA